MAFMTDNAFDAALNYIRTNTSALHICSAEPANYTEATSTYDLGNKASPTIGTPVNGDTSGRKIVMSAITDGSVTATGTAAAWAVVYATGTELLGAEALASTQAVTSGNTFSLTETDMGIPDAA